MQYYIHTQAHMHTRKMSHAAFVGCLAKEVAKCSLLDLPNALCSTLALHFPLLSSTPNERSYVSHALIIRMVVFRRHSDFKDITYCNSHRIADFSLNTSCPTTLLAVYLLWVPFGSLHLLGVTTHAYLTLPDRSLEFNANSNRKINLNLDLNLDLDHDIVLVLTIMSVLHLSLNLSLNLNLSLGL